MIITLSQTDYHHILIDLIKRNGSWHSGTYNKADPTHFERGSAEFALGQAPTGEIDAECGAEIFLPIYLKADFDDCTWGVTFTFTEMLDDKTTAKVSAFFDRPFGEPNADGSWQIKAGDEDTFQRIFKNLLNAEKWGSDFEDDGMDPAGGYGLESHK